MRISVLGSAHFLRVANRGLAASFHPSGTLLASDGWESRLRLWDPILGRPLLNLTGSSDAHFSRDGRIVVFLEEKHTTYQVDPALEYRTFAHASREGMNYARPSIRHDGRVLAVGTDRDGRHRTALIEPRDLLAGGRIPGSHRPVVAAGDDARLVGR